MILDINKVQAQRARTAATLGAAFVDRDMLETRIVDLKADLLALDKALSLAEEIPAPDPEK